MDTAIIILLLIAAVIAEGFIFSSTINDLIGEMEKMRDYHNSLCNNVEELGKRHNILCGVVKDICDSLNAAGISAPEIKPKTEK